MRNVTRKAMMVVGLAGMMGAAAPAKAGDFALTIGLEGRNGNHLDLTFAKGGVTPVLVTQPVAVPVQRVWVPPVYRDVIERVWVPTTETRYRDVPVLDAWGRVIQYRREAYTVASGYWQDVTRHELVREGYWQTALPVGSAKKYYGTSDRDDHDRGGLRIGLALERKDRERGELNRGPMLGKAAPPRGPAKAGPMGEKGPAKNHDNGKLSKAGAIRR